MLDVAVRLLAEGGYPAMTLSQVANEAGYSNRLAQYYFESKVGLLSAVIEEVGRQRVKADMLTSPSGRAAVGEWISNMFAFMTDTPAHCRALHVIIVESVTTVPELKPVVHEMGRGGLTLVRAALARGMEDGSIAASTDVATTGMVVVALVRMTIDDWFFDPTVDLIARKATVFAALEVLAGAAPPAS
jgi:AcrR family transcriptional regulator